MYDEKEIRKIVEQAVYNIIREKGDFFIMERKVKVNASNRHVHITQENLEILFGSGYELTKVKDLIQPGEFASDETVTIAGPKGVLHNVRILGPTRKYTQVEVSLTDTFTLGIRNVPLRDSGSLAGSAPVTIIGPKGSLFLKEGLILAQRHVHMTPEDADRFGFKNGDWAKVRLSGARETVFEKVLIRVSPNYRLEMHLDIDEANSAFLTPDSWGVIE